MISFRQRLCAAIGCIAFLVIVLLIGKIGSYFEVSVGVASHEIGTMVRP